MQNGEKIKKLSLNRSFLPRCSRSHSHLQSLGHELPSEELRVRVLDHLEMSLLPVGLHGLELLEAAPAQVAGVVAAWMGNADARLVVGHHPGQGQERDAAPGTS